MLRAFYCSWHRWLAATTSQQQMPLWQDSNLRSDGIRLAVWEYTIPTRMNIINQQLKSHCWDGSIGEFRALSTWNFWKLAGLGWSPSDRLGVALVKTRETRESGRGLRLWVNRINWCGEPHWTRVWVMQVTLKPKTLHSSYLFMFFLSFFLDRFLNHLDPCLSTGASWHPSDIPRQWSMRSCGLCPSVSLFSDLLEITKIQKGTVNSTTFGVPFVSIF